MISIRALFENFRNAWSSQNKIKMKKKKLPSMIAMPNRGALNRIKKMNSKLSNMTKS